jgi:DNA-binding GntR family transcriptional regulator
MYISDQMRFPSPIAARVAPADALGQFVSSPRVLSQPAAFRLFHGAVPPTLTVRDQVAIVVAERVVEQQLAPGARVREQLLAEEFGVSKAPVSEALMLLEHFGLVESSARRGVFVCKTSLADFEDLVDYRATLARTFVPRFIEKQTHSDQDILRRYLAQMAELVAEDAKAFEFTELSDRCLLFIAMQAGSPRIAQAMCSISLQLLRYFALAARNVKQRRLLLDRWQDARQILAAGNAEQALAHFEQTAQIRGADIRKAIGNAQ